MNYKKTYLLILFVTIASRDNINEKKEVDVLVLYGFHPDEPLAYDVGLRLSEKQLDGVEVKRFRPNYMPEDIHSMTEKEIERIDHLGATEEQRFVRENYHAKFVLDLHEYPLETDTYRQPRYDIFFPGANSRLRNVLRNFVNHYPERAWICGTGLQWRSSYHSATIEYWSKEKDGKGSILTLDDGEKFALSLIHHLKSDYL